MKHPVSNINICFYSFPDENEEIDNKPEISLRLKQFVDICDKEPSEKEGTYNRGD
jgi:hypothetical protein